MTYDRYYYSVLSDNDKQIYKKIYEGITAFEPHISLPNVQSFVPLNEILNYVGLDNPHIFYVDFNWCKIGSSLFGKFIELIYWYTKDEVAELNEKVQTVLNKMLHRVSGNTEFEKELSVHDLLIENIDYDFSALDNLHKHSPRSNTILGVLFYKTAVCEGVAKVFKMLLNMLDIKCIVVAGIEARHGVPHAWNIVKINGKAYHTDVTWDISFPKAQNSYDYFNLTDSEILADHNPKIRYPVCNSTESNYYVHSGLLVSNALQAEKALIKAKLSGKRSATLKLNCNRSEFMSLMNIVLDIALKSGIVSGNSCRYSYNQERQTVTLQF